MNFLKLFIFVSILIVNMNARREFSYRKCIPCAGFIPISQDGKVNYARTLRELDELAQYFNLNKFSQLAHRIKFFEKIAHYPELTIFGPADCLIDDLSIDEKSNEEIEAFFKSLIVPKRYFTTWLPTSLTALDGNKIFPENFEISSADLKFKNGVLHVVKYIEGLDGKYTKL